MLSEYTIRDLGQLALAASKADQCEVLVDSGTGQLTRFAENTIHQNVAREETNLSVRAVLGKRIGVASGNVTTPEAVRELVAKAEALARNMPPLEDFVSLPGPQPSPAPVGFDEAAADLPAEARARRVIYGLEKAKEAGVAASGRLSNHWQRLGVFNSLGLAQVVENTSVAFSTVMTAGTGAGYAACNSWRYDDLEVEEKFDLALAKAMGSRDPIDFEPGRYTVLLEPAAVEDLLGLLAWAGLSAKQVQEDTSFMAGHLGEQLTGANFTLFDDGQSPAGMPMACDWEGVPRKRVELITRGVAMGPVYDSYTAFREGKQSTGHAGPAPNPYGPYPACLFIEPGQASFDELLASVDKGLLVTRFHYTNLVHHKRVIGTGMTRDGTFLLEKGQIGAPVRNLRFTENLLEAFARIAGLGREVERVGSTVVPAMVLEDFHFNGKTEF